MIAIGSARTFHPDADHFILQLSVLGVPLLQIGNARLVNVRLLRLHLGVHVAICFVTHCRVNNLGSIGVSVRAGDPVHPDEHFTVQQLCQAVVQLMVPRVTPVCTEPTSTKYV